MAVTIPVITHASNGSAPILCDSQKIRTAELATPSVLILAVASHHVNSNPLTLELSQW